MQLVAFDRTLNNETYKLPGLFPSAATANPGFSVVGTGNEIPFAALATDTVPQLAGLGASSATRFFARWATEDQRGGGLFDVGGRISNLNPKKVNEFQQRFGADLSDDDVFAYAYGILHSPEFRHTFGPSLRKSAPRIALVASRADFDAFAAAGSELLELHIGYESAEPYPLTEEWATGADASSDPSVLLVGTRKMAHPKAKDPAGHPERDRTRLIYNQHLTLAGIPVKAYDYVLGTRSGIDWIIDRYYVKTDAASGIVNDPNQWGLERGQPRYIVDLIKRVVAVSIRTVEIVEGLPHLSFDAD
jgi:predicted helicase